MTICPLCGEEVQDMDVMFHKCAPNPEYGNYKEEQKIEFVDLLKEFLEYSFLTRRVYMMLSGFLSFRQDEKTIDEYLEWLVTYLTTRYEWENKINIKWLVYNSSTIMIPIWLVTILLGSEFLLGELGEVLGFIVLVSPPFLIYFAIKFMLKGKDTYTSIFLTGHILIIIFYILFIYFIMMMTSS